MGTVTNLAQWRREHPRHVTTLGWTPKHTERVLIGMLFGAALLFIAVTGIIALLLAK